MMTPSPSSGRFELGKLLLQKYRIEHVLGQGGMGVVLAVKHTELGVLFAMKLLLSEAIEQHVVSERFLSEARAAARLVSDHVVRVYDVGKLEDGSPYMLMEHLEGVDLETLLEASGPLPEADVIDYMLQALDGIIEAHALGIVHRDLKPANLFLAKRPGGHSSVKVLDFGISREVGRKGPSLTHSGSLMGTPYYMSPEQMRSSKDVDTRSDVWALGVVLYELLTDSVPFPGNSVTEVCARVLEGERMPLSIAAPNAHPGLVAIVDRCLCRAPEHRFQSAEDLAAALRAHRLELGAASVRPRDALQSFTGTNLERVGDKPHASWSLDTRDQGAPKVATNPGGSAIDVPAMAVVDAGTSELAADAAEPVSATESEIETDLQKTTPPPGLSPLAVSQSIPAPPRIKSATMAGWSDSPRPRRATSSFMIAALACIPFVAFGVFLSTRAVISHGSTMGSVDGSSLPGTPSVIETAAALSAPAESVALLGPVVLPAERALPVAPVRSAVASSHPMASASPSLSRTTIESATPVASTSKPAPPALQPGHARKHEGIY